jgi:hypothetical protein
MKNIHIVPTEQPSRLHYYLINRYALSKEPLNWRTASHIYITSDEEIKEGVNQWYLDLFLNKPYQSSGAQYNSKQDIIILTTDPNLIEDGVQEIDDEFLKWFVKNPTCEFVEVDKNWNYPLDKSWEYKISIPNEEHKQETLEEAAERHYINCIPSDRHSFIAGANYQAERMYSEEEVKELVEKTIEKFYKHSYADKTKAEMKELWFEQFKKK